MIVLSLYTVLITQRETVEKIYAVNQYLTEDRLKEAPSITEMLEKNMSLEEKRSQVQKNVDF